MTRKLFQKLLVLLPAAVLILGMQGCGNDEDSPDGSPALQGGQVAVLLTDGPALGFEEIWVTVTSVSLIAEDGVMAPIFSGEEDVNLKDLESDSTLFSVAEDVPPGTYNKIRMRVTGVTLVTEEGEEITPKLPGNGKIDLHPRSPFEVVGGEALLISLDMDANKSIHIVEAGKSGKYIFRPVIFVDVGSSFPDGKLVRLRGTVAEVPEPDLAVIGGSFQLCPPSPPDPSPYNVGKCTWIGVSDQTSLLDEDADLITLDALQEGSIATAIGRVGSAGGPEYGAPMVFLNALLIEAGDFLTLKGAIAEVPAADGANSFDFDVDPGQGISSDPVLPTDLQPGAKIFSRSGELLQESDLLEGKRAEIDGVLSVDQGALKAVLAVLGPIKEETGLEDVIDWIEAPQRTLFLKDGSCAVIPESAGLFRIEESTGSEEKVTVTPVSFAAFLPGMTVSLFGDPGSPCLEVTEGFIVEED